MSVYKDKTQGTWYTSFRYVDWTGKKRQKMKRGFKTKRDALNYENEFKASVAVEPDMQMDKFIDIYFSDKRNELKESSMRNKRHMMNKHILPYFATKKLNSDADKLDFWTKEEYETFISGVNKQSEDYLMFEILFWTGIREGELLALTLSDFDMSNNLLHINKTYHRINGKDVISSPKTDNSVRTIIIPNFLKEEVQEYIGQYYGLPESERLFPIVARTLQKRLKKYEEKTGVKPIRVHDLRHSHVAYLINQGVEPLIIKERLGHKNIQITLNTYGHLYPSRQKEIAEMLDEKR